MNLDPKLQAVRRPVTTASATDFGDAVQRRAPLAMPRAFCRAARVAVPVLVLQLQYIGWAAAE